VEEEVAPPSQSVEEEVAPPSQSVEEEAAPPSQSVEEEVAPPSQSVEEEVAPPSQSVEEEAEPEVGDLSATDSTPLPEQNDPQEQAPLTEEGFVPEPGFSDPVENPIPAEDPVPAGDGSHANDGLTGLYEAINTTDVGVDPLLGQEDVLTHIDTPAVEDVQAVETEPVIQRDWMPAPPSNWGTYRSFCIEVNHNENARSSFLNWMDHTLDGNTDASRLGIGHMAVGNDEIAKPFLQASSDDLSQLLLGQVQIREHDSKQALETWGKLTSSPEVSNQARLCLLEQCVLRFDTDTAKSLLETIKEDGGSDPANTAFAEGLAAESQGDHAGAEAAWRIAIQHQPDHHEALFHLARHLDRTGNDAEAIECYERFLAETMHPNVGALMNLGVLYEDLDDFASAKRCYQQVVQHQPTNRRAHQFLEDADASIDQYYDETGKRDADKQNAVLRIPVTDFELSVRARNCLQRMNLHVLGDLICRTESELLSYKNFGETSLMEVKEILSSKGLRLGMRGQSVEQPEIPQEEETSEDILAKPVSALELSVRSRAALRILNLRNIGELVNTPTITLMSCRNFGQTSLDEIQRKLANFGLAINS
ncbi:MAG: DNA-directed RNA polymerase subunit alpha C-terminal domain-containing protein, partial [Planctomycetota bacterium]|nr:DNA-directed RNA polymerase subunit alpha C-terminal domain-containing protein [Planctomycetota bacterium]